MTTLDPQLSIYFGYGYNIRCRIRNYNIPSHLMKHLIVFLAIKYLSLKGLDIFVSALSWLYRMIKFEYSLTSSTQCNNSILINTISFLRNIYESITSN